MINKIEGIGHITFLDILYLRPKTNGQTLHKVAALPNDYNGLIFSGAER